MTASRQVVRQVTGPVAGIAIVHELEDGIALEPHERAGWEWSGDEDEAIVVHHRVRPDNVGDEQPSVFSVNERIRYYSGRQGGTDVAFQDQAGGSRRILRTLVPGRTYAVNYDARPEQPVLRRQIEMAVYSLAIGERGRGVMAHGCGAVLPGGQGVLCLGRSGAGKSTLGRMLRAEPGVQVLNDDRIIVTPDDGGLRIWSTPWPGRAGIATPGDAPLGAVALIGRSDRCVAARPPRPQVLGKLLTTVALPLWAPDTVSTSLSLVERLLEEVPMTELCYPLDDDTGGWIIRTLSGLTDA